LEFICDFHIHSHFSVATSSDLIPEKLNYWAGIKGIKVVGTGDFTHPGWLSELREKLEQAEPGLFRLKKEYILGNLPLASIFHNEVRFILTAEISNIYKKDGKVRKVHNLIFAPDFEAALNIQNKLSSIGNICSDGRPILGLSSRDLVELVFNCSEHCFVVPSHIWTPWFSALGSQSGFDSIEECYEDLSSHIFAVETGLSSDPPMNWICSFLDRYTLISNSDAHSPQKLGREANILSTELNYQAIIEALKNPGPMFLGTVEFFPQEGKYHFDGHRKCGVCMNPLQSFKENNLCPVCGKKITVGVLSRVAQLADRDNPLEREKRAPFYSLIPLQELLSEIAGAGPGSKKVENLYYSLLKKNGPELEILLKTPLEEIENGGGFMLAEGIRRMRNGEVIIKEGYDGEYGRVKVFDAEEIKDLHHKGDLFSFDTQIPGYVKRRKLLDFDIQEYRILRQVFCEPVEKNINKSTEYPFSELNSEQLKAVEHSNGPALIIAGPGTGKTRVLAYLIARLIQKEVPPSSILALTFTNRAADEMKNRIIKLCGNVLRGEKQKVFSSERYPLDLRIPWSEINPLEGPVVSTFHSVGLDILKQNLDKTGRREGFFIVDERDRLDILGRDLGVWAKKLEKMSSEINWIKQSVFTIQEIEEIRGREVSEIFKNYEEKLRFYNAFDLDDLVYLPVCIFRSYPDILMQYRKRWKWLLIDEYQDINSAQYRMVQMLMPDKDSNICAIGDPDQAIYGFRGADAEFIHKFSEDYPEAVIYRLTRSYRCPETILRASWNLIKNGNTTSIGEDSLKGVIPGVKIKVIENSSDKSEAEFVARTIEQMMGGLRFFSMDSRVSEGRENPDIESLSDFAVLFRTKEQMGVVERAFQQHSIPYQVVGNVPFYKEEPLNLVIDLIKLSLDNTNRFLRHRVSQKGIIFNDKGLASVKEGGVSVKKLALLLVEKYLNKQKLEHEHIFNNFFNFCEDFNCDLQGFLRYVDLGIGADTYRPGVERVALMSLHAAKGCEFSCVFITGCEDGLVPYSLFTENNIDLDEERRLLYVGMTRAKRFLFFTHARRRFIFGREFHLKRSAFLDNIEKKLMDTVESEYRPMAKKYDPQLGLFN